MNDHIDPQTIKLDCPDAPPLEGVTISDCVNLWTAAKAWAEAAGDTCNDAVCKAHDLFSPRPAECLDRRGNLLSDDEMGRLDDHELHLSWPSRPGTRLMQYDQSYKQCLALEAAFDVPRLSAIETAAFAELHRISNHVLATPPTTGAEAAFKLRVLIFRNDCDEPMGLLFEPTDEEHLRRLVDELHEMRAA